MVTGVRPPVVAGIAGGVGTTTLAVALRAHDAGRAGGAGVPAADILACRATFDSLRRAGAVLERAALAPGPGPVLAVALGAARVPRGPLRARLELLEDATSGVVLLPHVDRWATVADPLAEVAELLVDPAPPPRALRAYVDALRELAAAVTASGRLSAPPPDPTGRDRHPGDPRGRAPVAGRPPDPSVAPARPVTRAAPAPPAALSPRSGLRPVGLAPRVVTEQPPARRGVRVVAAAPQRSAGRIEQAG